MNKPVSHEQSSGQIRHGKVFQPASRAQILVDSGLLDNWVAYGLEAGKFFPAQQSNLLDPFAPEDIANNPPPVDGKIASAGQAAAAILDETGRERWQKHQVRAGQELEVAWSYHAIHLTRRWNYFITKADWDPAKPLSRAQFEATPFYQDQLDAQPFWSHHDALTPPDPTRHVLHLPQRGGYHVILAVWEVADTGNAFYQVIDVDFTG